MGNVWLLAATACFAASSAAAVCAPRGEACRADLKDISWHTDCGSDTHCKLCGFCQSCAGPEDCVVCKDGYRLQVVNSTSCTGRCVPSADFIGEAVCEPRCSCNTKLKKSRNLRSNAMSAVALSTLLLCSTDEYESVDDESPGCSLASVGASCSSVYGDALCAADASGGFGCYRCQEYGLECFSVEFLEVEDQYGCSEMSDIGVACSVDSPDAVCELDRDFNVFGCYLCPNELIIPPLDCTTFQYLSDPYGDACSADDHYDGTNCARQNAETRSLCTFNPTNEFGCWTCPLPPPLGVDSEVVSQVSCPKGSCDSCDSRYIECDEDDAELCSVTGRYCVEITGVGSGYQIMNNSAPSSDYSIVVGLRGVNATFGASVGGVLLWSGGQSQGPDTWHCGSGMGTSVSKYERCRLRGCGPFEVQVAAASGVVWSLRICQDSPPTSEHMWCDCFPEGTCGWDAQNQVICVCPSSDETGFFSPESNCKGCAEGYFPQDETSTMKRCTGKCRNYGTVDSTQNACDCAGSYEGDQCETCGSGKMGAYCNETASIMAFDFETSFTLSDTTFQPPLWKVYHNSEATVSFTSYSDVDLREVLNGFRLTAVTDKPSLKHRPLPFEGRAAFEVDAAYYGPQPGVSSFTGKKYLHVFVGNLVHLYTYASTTEKFTMDSFHEVDDYYKEVDLDRCKEYFGDEWYRDYDDVIFWQDPAVGKSGYDSSSACGSYATRDYLVFVKGDRTCWVNGDPDFGRPWSVSSIGQFTGWDRIEGLFMATPDGTYWQNYEGIEFMEVFNDVSLADQFSRPNAMRADYLMTEECLDQFNKSSQWLRDNCVSKGDQYVGRWDAMFTMGDMLVMVKNQTVRHVNITGMLCCNGTEYDSQPVEYCTRDCETSHDSGVRLYGNALQSWRVTEGSYPASCTDTNDYSTCTEATYIINKYIQNATVTDFFNNSIVARITAVAYGRMVTGISTEATLPAETGDETNAEYDLSALPENPQTEDIPADVALPRGTQLPDSIPGGYGTDTLEGQQQQGAKGASCIYEHGEDEFPLLVFQEHSVLIVRDSGVVVDIIANVFPGLQKGFPHSMAWHINMKLERKEITSASRTLSYTVGVFDENNAQVFLTEPVHAVLLQCGSPLSDAASTCKATLAPWTNAAELENAIRSPEDCTEVTSAVLTGETARGVFAKDGWFVFQNMGISMSGVFKIRFVHQPTGLSITSPNIFVSDTECGKNSEYGDSCFVDCKSSATKNTASCAIVMDPNKAFLGVHVDIAAFMNINIVANLFQPCCNGAGLCCAGTDDCITHTDSQKISPRSYCTCVMSLDKGMFDFRHDCAQCLPGYDMLQGCRASSFANFKTTSYSTSAAHKLPPGKRHFFVVETQPETHLNTRITTSGGTTDADLSVAFVSCPGQETVLSGVPGELSPVCHGEGTCLFNKTSGDAECVCSEGRWGKACDRECCSGQGFCDQDTGDNCKCTDTWAAVPRTVTRTPATLSTFLTQDEVENGVYDNPHHKEVTMNGTTGEAFRAYVQWKGMDVPGKDAVTYAAIELTQADSTPCSGTPRLHVYATQPATIGLPADDQATFCLAFDTEAECTGMGCCLWLNNQCLGTNPSDPASSNNGCKALCNILNPRSREPANGCGVNAAFANDSSSEHFGMCRCDEGFVCSWGRCKNASTVCGVAAPDCGVLGLAKNGEICDCVSKQNAESDRDTVDILYCEAAQCVTPVYSLNYTWSATDLETKNLTDIPDLQTCLSLKEARFYGPIANYPLTTIENNTVNVIVITDWLKSITQHLNSKVYDQMDLSFSIVIEPHEDSVCVPTYHSAASVNETLRPRLVIQSKGNHQPTRLFLPLQDDHLTSLQSGHPFYGMWTADTILGVKEIGTPSSTAVRKVRRYASELLSGRTGKSTACLDQQPPYPASAACQCGMTETRFQDSEESITRGLQEASRIWSEKKTIYDTLNQTESDFNGQKQQLELSLSQPILSCDEKEDIRREIAEIENSLEMLQPQIDVARKQFELADEERTTWKELQEQKLNTFQGHMNDPDGRFGHCPCSDSAIFQDPIDFTQIGEWMYFLAHTDWESSSDASPPCSSAEEVFQGSREVFFTKGTPGHTPGREGVTGFQDGIEEDDTFSTQSQTEARLGTSEFPKITGVSRGKWGASTIVRSNAFSMKVFTRAKELAKMRNPNCNSGLCGEIASEVLLFVGTSGGGDSPSSLAQEPSESNRAPGLWMSEVISATGKPKAPLRIAEEIIFPSYVTTIARKNSKRDVIFFLGVKAETESFTKSPSAEGYDQLTGEHASKPLKHPYRYAVPTSFSVIISDSSSQSVIDPEEPNIGPCHHPQGHPGFTYFNDFVVFYFADSTEDTIIYGYKINDNGNDYKIGFDLSYKDSNGNTVALIPSIPPLDKGYFKPVVIRNNEGTDAFILLSLGEPASPIDDVCLEAAGCDASDPKKASPLHQYQKSFRCLNKNRGITDLWWWDGNDTEAELGVHLGRVHTPVNDTEYPQDPTWTLVISDNRFFWVKHETGLSNRGFMETRANTHDHTRDRQVLMFTEYDFATKTWASKTVWEPGDAVHIYDLTLWNTNVLFWAYTDLADDDCWPPGSKMVFQGKVLTAGVNIPAYSGCPRALYVTTLSGNDVKIQHRGSETDGVGVPRSVQCCEDVVNGAPAFNASDPSHAVARMVSSVPGCKECVLQRKFWGWDHDELCCDGVGPVGTTSCKAGCDNTTHAIPSAMRNMKDFIYPRYNHPDNAEYSETAQWSKPSTGWWFTGFHSLWVDARMSRAGVPVWNLGTGLLDMGTKGNEKRLATGAFPGMVGYEMYRPGGFAWREHWPRTIGVWEEQADALKNDCEGCQAGYYGPKCASACPTYKGKVCNGYSCNEGIYGDGECDCKGERGGIACETNAQNKVYYYTAASDTIIEDFSECTSSTSGVTCYVVGDSSFAGSPNEALCIQSTGCATESGYCCGASEAPINLGGTNVMIIAWTGLDLTAGMDIINAVLVLDEYAESTQHCTDTPVNVYELSKWSGFPEVGLFGVDTLAGLYPLGSPISTWLQRPPKQGSKAEFSIADWLKTKVSAASWDGSVAFAVTSGCTAADCCIPSYKSREYSTDWGAACTSMTVGCTTSTITVSDDAPHLRVTIEPEKPKCTTYSASRCFNDGFYPVSNTDVYCATFSCDASDCCEVHATSQVTISGITAEQAATEDFRKKWESGLSVVLDDAKVTVTKVQEVDGMGSVTDIYSAMRHAGTLATHAIIVTSDVVFKAQRDVAPNDIADDLDKVRQETELNGDPFANVGLHVIVGESSGQVDNPQTEAPLTPEPNPMPPPPDPKMPNPMPPPPDQSTPQPVPQNDPSNMPQANDTSDAPQSNGTSDAPQANDTSDVPQANDTSDVLQANGTDAPQSNGTSDVPQTNDTSVVTPEAEPAVPVVIDVPPDLTLPPGPTPPIPGGFGRKGRELLADMQAVEVDTSRYPDSQLLEFADTTMISTPVERSLFKVPACIEDLPDAVEGPVTHCNVVVPRTAGFAVVRVLSFDGAIDYELKVEHVPRGNFDSSTKLGECETSTDDGYWTGSYCRECKYRWSGESCTEYSPSICNSTTCDPDLGQCVSDPSTGNLRKMCLCHPMDEGYSRHGVACDVVCNPVLNCSGHGTCWEDGSCSCEANWNKNTDCSECSTGKWGPDCTFDCTCNVPVGMCDTSTGTCIAALGCSSDVASFAGENCRDCAEGYYPVDLCNKFCTASTTCNGHGVCSSNGECNCDDTYYGPRCQEECSSMTTCSGHGQCIQNLDEPYVACSCEGNWGNGYEGDWNMMTLEPTARDSEAAVKQCSACDTFYYEEQTNCVSECWCNLRGRCTSDGECICYQDLQIGFYAGSSCRMCAQGYSRNDTGHCVLKVSTLGEPGIGRSQDFFGTIPTKGKRSRPPTSSALHGLPGCTYHTTTLLLELRREGQFVEAQQWLQSDAANVEALRMQDQNEYLFVSAGYVSNPEDLYVEVWVQVFRHTLELQQMNHFSAYATISGEKRGNAVLGVFQYYDHIYYVVYDGAVSYLLRTGSVPEDIPQQSTEFSLFVPFMEGEKVEIMNWGFIEKNKAVYALIKHTAADKTVNYIISCLDLDTSPFLAEWETGVFTHCVKCNTISSLAAVDSMYINEWDSAPVALVFGTTDQGVKNILKIFLPAVNSFEYQSVSGVVPVACVMIDCILMERYVPLNYTHGVLLIRTMVQGVASLAVQPLILNNLKVQDVNLVGLHAAPYGLGGMQIDPFTGMLYVAVGGVDANPSSLYKVRIDFEDLGSSPDVLQRSLGYGHTQNEVEQVAAMELDPFRRALLLLCPVNRTLITIFNLYDVESITPNVVDAPKAGTVVTVRGAGFTDLNGQYAPMCRMGDTISNGTFVDANTILCSSTKPSSYSSCDTLSLEVSITRHEHRFTDTATQVRRIGTPAVFDVTDSSKLPSETMILPKHGPISNSYSVDEQRRDLQVFSYSYADKSVEITIPGAGFLDTEYILCTINGSFYPAVYMGTTVICKFDPPQDPFPVRTTIELTLDGQAYSENKQQFLFVGEPVRLEGYFVCNPCTGAVLSVVQPDDLGVVTLATLLFRFTDSVSNFVGALGQRWLDANVTLETSSEPCPVSTTVQRFPFAERPSAAVENGRAVFKGISGSKPALGCYMLQATYLLSSGAVIRSDPVELVVVAGRPKTVAFVTTPPPFSNNRNILTRQPSIAVKDGAGNLVNLAALQVRVELDLSTLPEGLKDPVTKVSIVVVEGGVTSVNDQDLYAFEFLRIKASGMAGRNITFKKTGPTSLEELKFILDFKVLCKGGAKECADLTLDTLHHEMHIADCSTTYIGNSRLAWIEPEEQPAGSPIPITVKGWEFREPSEGEGVYKCVYHDAESGRWLGAASAAFRDSCTLVCDHTRTRQLLGTRARMTNVRPAFCCDGNFGISESCPTAGAAEVNCFQDGTYNWFNETSYKISYYHRYTGPASIVRVWNAEAVLGRAEAGVNLYESTALRQQASYSFITPDPSQSLGFRFIDSGNYVANLRERHEFEYRLLLYSEILVGDASVLRAGAKTIVSGKSIWTPPNKEWEMQTMVNNLVDKEIDTSLRVAVVDDSVGFLGWRGNWVASMDVVSLYEQDKEVSLDSGITRAVKVKITPTNTQMLPGAIAHVASVKGGIAKSTYAVNLQVKGTNLMTQSYLVFEEIAMLYPAKGEYALEIALQGLPPIVKTFVVKEGLPHRVVFDSAEWDLNGLEGKPVATMTINRELTTQPRFRLLDIADNTVTTLPAKHNIYVRATASPEPNCKITSCPWKTEPRSNTSAAAETERQLNNPVFSSQGIASYRNMRVVSNDVSTVTNLTFEFYGKILDQYGFELPKLQTQLDTIKCINNCFDLICDFQPQSLSLVSNTVATQPLIVYGDLFDFAQSVASGNSGAEKLRVLITFPLKDVTVQCELAAELANACAMTMKWPRCEYYCLNYYAPITTNVNGYTTADRESCCETGSKLNGLPCDPTSAVPFGRGAKILQSSSTTGALNSPVQSSLAVDTTGGGSSFAGRQSKKYSIKGEAVQIGASEMHLESDFYAIVKSDGEGYSETVLLSDFNVTSKDEAGNDMGDDDTVKRRIVLDTYFIPASGPRVLLDATKITYNTGIRSEIPEHSQQHEMLNGTSLFSFTLHRPVEGTYGILARDFTPESWYPEEQRLVSCVDTLVSRATECSKNGYIAKFKVEVGKPHRLAWAPGTKETVDVNNLEPQQLTQSIVVEDLAGNKLTSTDIVDDAGNVVPVTVAWTRQVPELSNSLALSRHGYTDSAADLDKLSGFACNFSTSNEVTLNKEVTFTFVQFRVWNAMTCKISFEAKLPDLNVSSAEKQVASKIRLSGSLVWTVSPLPCCPGNDPCTKYGYTFEFGCWNRAVGKPVPGVPPAYAQADSPFSCLTKCGECPSAGMKCSRKAPELKAASGYWREPVSYVSWECKEDNCKGGALGDLVGLTPEHDVNRSNAQCKEGTMGTFCGECASGYGKDQDTCVKCPNQTQNYFLIALVSVALITLIIILVAINLNTGPTIAEVSRVSVMVKMLMNHLQVTGLTSEIVAKNSKTLESLTEAESKGAGPGSSLISIGCAAPSLDYYDLFVVWMVIPVIVVVIPALVLLLKQLKDKLQGKQETVKAPYVPCVMECASPYHWLYDWVIIEKDREELRAAIDRCATQLAEHDQERRQLPQDNSSGSLLQINEQELNITFTESSYIKLETGRKSKVLVMDKVHGTETGAVEFAKAEYGCQLCLSCCILESLFPNNGVGSINKERYRISTEYDFKNLSDREWKLFAKLFPNTELDRGKGTKKSRMANEKMVKYAVARNPPWPVEGHTPELQESIPGKSGKLVAKRREKAELLVFGKGLTHQSYTENEKDTMTCEKVSGTGNSLWKVTRTDVVTGQKLERFTHVDPLTPPQSPGKADQADDVVIRARGVKYVFKPLLSTNREHDTEESTIEQAPQWLLENEDLSPRQGAFKKDALMPVPTNEAGTHIVHSVHSLASQIPYEVLYKMARVRRLHDKWNAWRQTLTPAEIKEKFENGSVEGIKEESVDDREDLTTENSDDTVGRKQLSPEFIAMLQKQDRELVVMETCELCYHDFAVVFDPHMDQYFCEECDRLVHKHDSKKFNTRMRLQPKTSPLAEHGVEVKINLWTVWKVAVIVILFLIYPSLTKEIALMLNCSESVCVDHGTCHSYLKADTRIDCDESPYPAFMVLSLLFFFVYGFGIPLVGWLLLRRHRHVLHTKNVLGTLGFLYSGFRRKCYYWEMVIMVRKMLIVFIVVFLDNSENYQLYFAMWTMLFFALLNIFAKPFKYNVLWRLETISLLSITVSLNIGLIYFEDPSSRVDVGLSVTLLLLNIVVLLVFVKNIFVEGKAELVQMIDEDGDGNVTCEEITTFAQTQWREKKPAFLRSRWENEVLEADRTAKTDKEKYPNRRERWQWFRDMTERNESVHQRQTKRFLTESEMQEWWPVAYGEVAAQPSPTQSSPHSLAPATSFFTSPDNMAEEM